MPTTYPGDKTQTQAPSAPPSPEAQISVELPVDGDPTNGSTYEQGYKVVADFIDWLMKPQAKSVDWNRATMAFRTALGHKRFAVDHMGFPSGLVGAYEANWLHSPAVSFANPSGTAETHFKVQTDWRYKALQGSGTASAQMGGDSFGPVLFTSPGETAADYVTCSTGNFTILRTDNHVALDTAASVPGSATRTIVIGLSDAPTSHVLAENNFIGFRVVAGGTVWQCVTKSAGVETVHTSAITANLTAAGTRADRLRIEWHGEGVSDNATRQVRFYINGVLEAAMTTTLPLGMNVGLAVADVRASGGVDTDFLAVRPMRLRWSLHDADAAI